MNFFYNMPITFHALVCFLIFSMLFAGSLLLSPVSLIQKHRDKDNYFSYPFE